MIAATDAQGKETVRHKSLPNTNNGEIIKFFQSFDEPVEVAIEATRNWYWLYDLLEEAGVGVKLPRPVKTKAIASAKTKNDKIDSRGSRLLPLVICVELRKGERQ